MALYFAAAICIFGAAIYGYVQWFLGSNPWALLIVPISLLTIVALHVASMIGQSLSSDQMELLRGRLDRTLEIAFDDAADG